MNCKPGDLAIIIRDDVYKCDFGKLVEILNRDIEDTDRLVWECKPLSPIMGSTGNDMDITSIPDSWLKPVSGLPMEEATKETIKEKA
jgi:hypothetical protein